MNKGSVVVVNEMEETADNTTGLDVILALRIAPLIQGNIEQQTVNVGKSIKKGKISLFNKALGKTKRLNCIIGAHKANVLVSLVNVKWDCVENEVRVLIKHT